jgi:hemerythrin superfamily protein
MAKTTTHTDAISLLKKDHAAVEALFKRFERSHSAAEKKRLADRMVRELSIHAAVEEQLVYPALRSRLDGDAGKVLLALEEHHFAKVALSEIEAMQGADERFDAKVRVLIANVRHHVAGEERDLLPELKRSLTPEELRDLGANLAVAKKGAPTRPHPAAPDAPPANLFTNPPAAVLDRSRDAVSRGIERVLDRGRDVVDDALGRAEAITRQARRRIGRGLERAGREVQPDIH